MATASMLSRRVSSLPAIANIVVIAPQRGGAGVVLSAFAGTAGVACCAAPLHRSHLVRAEAHAAAFGERPVDVWEGYPPQRYLDVGLREAAARLGGIDTVVSRVTYDQVAHYALYDDLAGMRDVRLVHIRRNPIAAYISLQQALRSGRWSWPVSAVDGVERPRPVWIEPEDLVRFVREADITARRVDAGCRDVLSLRYGDLVRAWPRTAQRLEAFAGFAVGLPAQRRLPGAPAEAAVGNWRDVVAAVRRDLSPWLEDLECDDCCGRASF